jgi:hypothetical protein
LLGRAQKRLRSEILYEEAFVSFDVIVAVDVAVSKILRATWGG